MVLGILKWLKNKFLWKNKRNYCENMKTAQKESPHLEERKGL